MHTKLAIVTPVHNRRAETLQFLSSIFRSDLKGIDVSVYIVDDGSTDGTAEAVRKNFPDVNIIAGGGDLWFTEGTNRGITAALADDPDLILTCNNDSIFDRSAIARLVECCQRHERSIVGGLLLDWSTPHKVFQVAPKWDLWKGGNRHWFHQTVWTVPKSPWYVEMIVGNCVLFPASAIREAGLMDSKRFPQYGDAEYTPRLRKLGWKLLVEPRARVFCKPNDPPSGFRNLPLTEKFRRLFSDPFGPYSLRRRFNATMAVAPNKVEGLAAVVIFGIRVILGISQESRWAASQPEPPLSEIYASSVAQEDS
ncbi:MAG: glycosyltransferase family 2 protein [Acidobacteriota bacterium]|nr:MAG: glycosyltransferase family 2 protein [Acidobacteriota bacterium]